MECSKDGIFTYQFKAAGLVKGALTLTRDAKTQDILIANAAGDIVDAGCKFYLIAPLNITYNPATNGLSYDGNAPAAQMTLKDSFSTQVNGHIFASAGKDALSYTNTASAARFKVSFTAGQAYTVTPK